MKSQVQFYHIDHNYVGFSGDSDILYELRNKYSFYASGYKWDKRYRLGYWDGKLSILNMKDRKMYAGLLPRVLAYLDSEGIKYEDTTRLISGVEIDDDQVIEFYKRIKGPFTPHDSQISAFRECVARGRNIILAPTSNGKSYIMHGLNAYYTFKKLRTLIIINRSQLVLQLRSNFEDEYGSAQFYSTSTIYDDDNDTDVVITTWQSLLNKDASWFKQFDVLIADECHGFKAKALIGIVNKCGHIAYRHGLTATLDNDSKVDALTLEGMFGEPVRTITLKEQIAQGISARPIIYAIKINYSAEDRKALMQEIKQQHAEAVKKGRVNAETLAFQTECKFIENHQGRTELIARIAKSMKGNTLIAFKNESHGKAINEKVRELITDRPIFMVYGKIAKEKRFAIQKELGRLKDSVSTVSFGTFSTGINVVSLNNLIIGSQVKSEITVPQLIGRMIRLCEGKTTASVVDICDDLSTPKRKNIFYNHFEKRMEFYLKNDFEVKFKTINL